MLDRRHFESSHSWYRLAGRNPVFCPRLHYHNFSQSAMILPADMLPVPAIINCQPNKVEKDAMNISLRIYLCQRGKFAFLHIVFSYAETGGGGGIVSSTGRCQPELHRNSQQQNAGGQNLTFYVLPRP